MTTSFDARTRTVGLASAECRIPSWSFRLEADGKTLSSADARASVLSPDPLRLRLSFAEPALEWDLAFEEVAAEGRLIVTGALRNRGTHPVKLGRVHPLDASSGVELGPAGGGAAGGGAAGGAPDIVALPLAGLQTPRNLYRLDDSQCPRQSKIKTQFYRRDTSSAFQAGFLTFGRADTIVSHEHAPGRGIGRLEAWCDFAGWELAAGAETPTETFTVACGSDPYAQLTDWADRAAVLVGHRDWEDPPIGWVGWAWVDGFTVERYEDVVLRNAAAVTSRLGGFGLRYVWVSLGNLRDGVPGDWLQWDTTNFPSGPEALVRRLRQHGLSLGLWCGAFWLCATAEAMRDLADAILPGPDGKRLVARAEWQIGKAGWMAKKDRPVIYGLDPTHPKTLAMLREVFTTYRRWGVRYYMIDFLHAAAGSVSNLPYSAHYDRSIVANAEAYRTGLAAIREAAGDDTYLLAATGPSIPNAGFFDAIRTGNDFGEGRALYPDSYFYPATFVINSGEFWTGPQHALLNQATHWYTHRRLYLNDSGNVLTVDKPLPLTDAQVHATIHAFSGGPSMIGDDIDRMEDERLALIKKTLPRPRDVAFPVGLFRRAHPELPRVFHRRVEKPWGRYDVVAVYNFGADLMRENVAMADLGLDPRKGFHAFEFWNCEYLGRFAGTLPAVVPPHSVRVYRLTPDTGSPALMGTDMHLLMGEVELLEYAWDPATMTLSGRAIRPVGETGNLFINAPEGLRVKNPEGLWIAKDARDRTLIIRVALRFGGGPDDGRFRVVFAPVASPQELLKEHDRG